MSQGNPTQHEIDVYCAQWILNGGDQSKAWRVAYPDSTMNADGARVKACNMHKMVNVQLTLAKMQEEQAEKDGVEFDLSVSELKEKLNQIIDCGMEKDASGKYAGLGASTSAIAEFNRMSGNHATVKTDITVTELSPEKRKERISKLLGECKK